MLIDDTDDNNVRARNLYIRVRAMDARARTLFIVLILNGNGTRSVHSLKKSRTIDA